MGEPTVLVIDDYRATAVMVQSLLEDMGLSVDIATEVRGDQGAIEKFRKNNYHLIICDNQIVRRRIDPNDRPLDPTEVDWGTNVIPRLKDIKGEIVTILMSTEDVSDHPADAFINKNNLGRELIPKVRELLKL